MSYQIKLYGSTTYITSSNNLVAVASLSSAAYTIILDCYKLNPSPSLESTIDIGPGQILIENNFTRYNWTIEPNWWTKSDTISNRDTLVNVLKQRYKYMEIIKYDDTTLLNTGYARDVVEVGRSYQNSMPFNIVKINFKDRFVQ
jgi:hypothetical protein